MLVVIPWFSVARLYGWILRTVGYGGRIRGMGFMLRRVRSDRIIEAEGLRFYFNHAVAGCYDALVARKRFGESETHRFLASALGQLPVATRVACVDVGANIGEISLDVARHPRVSRVIAVEPNPECARALVASAALNGLDGRIAVKQEALSSWEGLARFHLDERSPTASHLAAGDETFVEVRVSTLDRETAGLEGEIIVKIDVEGAELDVLRGGASTLATRRPLLIFEFNETSRCTFSLDDVRSVLGSDYTIWRLRGDGLLDEDFSATWNCVAAHGATGLGRACRALACPDPSLR